MPPAQRDQLDFLMRREMGQVDSALSARSEGVPWPHRHLGPLEQVIVTLLVAPVNRLKSEKK